MPKSWGKEQEEKKEMIERGEKKERRGEILL